MPAIRHWNVPDYWLQSSNPGAFRTIRSPFDTVFLRLPTGQAMGVDLRNNGFDMTWYWEPVTSPVIRDRTVYFLLDSLDQPKRLTDYTSPAQNSAGCPGNDAVRDCKVSSSRSLLKAGPLEVSPGVGGSDLMAQREGRQRLDELRRFGLTPPKPMIFVRMSATISQSSAFESRPELQSAFRAFAKPTILWTDRSTLGPLLGPVRVLTRYVDLAYDGAGTWRLDEAESLDLRDAEAQSRPKTAHRIEALTLDDLECCRWPDNSIKKQSWPSIAKAIEYRGEKIAYDPVPPAHGKIPVLIDPDGGKVISLASPAAKVIWMLP